MTPTPTPYLFGPDAVTTIFKSLLANIAEGERRVYQTFWDALIAFLATHWLLVVVFLSGLFAVAVFRALMGRWGMLGSVLYNYLYFGILFAVGMVWGSDVFVTNVFSIVATLLIYPVCYLVVGWILHRTGLKNR